MATEAAPRELMACRAFPSRLGPKGNLLYKLITTTDHKLIGIMYMATCFTFFFFGGLLALFMRAELSAPGRPHRRWPVGTPATRWSGPPGAPTAAQLHRVGPHPFGAARLRAALPAHG